MRLPIIALALLFALLPGSTSAQTGIGVLDVWLKARESADGPNDKKITLYTKSKALVIGINAYDGRSWPQLSNGIRDAEEVAKGLEAQGFEVTLKKNLTSSDLENALKYFFHHEGDDPDARLLLWFAGHGYTLDGEGYIIPADAPSPKNVADFRDKAISLRRFGEYMREASAKHVLAIFDSCFSGTVFNVARSLPPPAITLATTQPVREFISSGEAEQQVSDDGTFRKLFLDALAGKEPDADANHDGYVTGTELGLFLHQKMTNFTNNRQTPRYGKLNAYGYDRGDFVFQVGKPDVPTTLTKEEIGKMLGPIFAHMGDPYSDADLQSHIGVVGRLKPPNPPSEISCGGRSLANVSLSSRSPWPLSDEEECALKQKDVFKECDNCPEMVVVPAGSFTMGSPDNEKGHSKEEGPQHMVTIAHAFAVGRFTVTVDQFAEFVKETGYRAGIMCTLGDWPKDGEKGRSFRDPGYAQTGSHPAVCLSWEDARAYVLWLSNKTQKSYRLLTEAEWEYAARGRTTPGTYPRYFFGDRDDDMCRYGNGADQTAKSKLGAKNWTIFNCDDSYAYTAPVGSFLPNAFGLYDMHGNVWQWLEDWWHDDYGGAPVDGSAWVLGDDSWRRVLRGGAWGNAPVSLRAAARSGRPVYFRNYVNGFRVGRTLPERQIVPQASQISPAKSR